MLSDLTPKTTKVKIGAQEYVLSELTIGDLSKIQAAYRRERMRAYEEIHPAATVLPQDRPLHAEMLSRMYGQAVTDVEFDEYLRSTGGLVESLLIVFERCNPKVSRKALTDAGPEVLREAVEALMSLSSEGKTDEARPTVPGNA